MTIKQTVQNTLSKDLLIRPEFIGGPQLLSPFLSHCATQRQMMWSSHSSQSMVLNHAEQPRIMTGYEKPIGEYEFSSCRITQDSIVRKLISKFDPIHYSKIARHMPSWKLIYIGDEDRKVHCATISTYTMVHENFGYFNKMLGFEKELLHEGSVIPKGEKLVTSPAHVGNRYMMGVNANVIYLATWGVTEDAFVVSKSLAAKCTNTAIDQVKLTIDYDNIPLNLYGTNGSYKCFPDIGDTVRHDGVLLALKKINKSTYIQDTAPANLRKIEQIHDEVHRAPPGARVIDVDVYINVDAEKQLKDRDASIYRQFFEIRDQHRYQQEAIVAAYKQLCLKEGLECSPEFHTQVVRAAMLSGNREFVGSKPPRLYDAREPVEFIKVVITYAYERELTEGSKLTGREGGKGVVSAIIPDEDMPVDDNGVRADIIMTPASVINRMNPSQLFEQFWNRVSLQVIRNIKDKYLGGWKDHEQPEDWVGNISFRQHWREMYDYIIGFCRDFREVYAQFLEETLPTDNDKQEFVEACLNEGIYLVNAFRKPITSEDIIAAAKKYGVKATPVTYNTIDKKTGLKRRIRTRHPMLIGSKFLLLLGKIPASSLSAVEIGYVSQFELPIKPKSKHVKSQSIIGLTPQKFGEDETCILNMSLRDDKVARFFALHSSAPAVVKMLGETLLTEPKPTALIGLPLHTQEVIRMNQNVSMNNHMFSVIGYSCVPPKDEKGAV